MGPHRRRNCGLHLCQGVLDIVHYLIFPNSEEFGRSRHAFHRAFKGGGSENPGLDGLCLDDIQIDGGRVERSAERVLSWGLNNR